MRHVQLGLNILHKFLGCTKGSQVLLYELRVSLAGLTHCSYDFVHFSLPPLDQVIVQVLAGLLDFVNDVDQLVFVMWVGHELQTLSANQELVVFNPNQRKTFAVSFFKSFINNETSKLQTSYGWRRI